MNKFNYDILFVGGIYEEGKEKEYLNKTKIGGIQNAVNTHQWNFIHGIESNNKKPVDILSARYVGSYPNYKEIYVKKNIWEHKEGAKDENIGFLNISILKNIERKLKLAFKAKKWAKTKKNNCKKVIICYYPSIPQMNATIKAKKKQKDITTVLIIPDIPQFMDLSVSTNTIKQKINNIRSEISLKMLKSFDKYIVLTKHMIDKLRLDPKKCIIIEGMINKNDCVCERDIYEKDFSKKSIVYAGSLHEKYGVKNFLEAIKIIKDKDISFYIFGDGELSNEIDEYSKIDTRVKFMGYQDRQTVLKYQKEATALINPRGDEYEYVKYSFPSKNLEYLISGSPVVCCKIPCIPEEYDDIFIYSKNNSADEIAKTILDIVNKSEDELKEIAIKSLKFAKENKEKDIQCYKMLDFINY